ncbi:RRP15-like protein [Schistocerca gregaria]|uniref:RRP15-like protein n=1 Tax=Schistocerca gregaria TaxID=7010 RepID=UPI00211E6413|nr:RRP15-like protein [Schistocerca gregaria]
MAAHRAASVEATDGTHRKLKSDKSKKRKRASVYNPVLVGDALTSDYVSKKKAIATAPTKAETRGDTYASALSVLLEKAKNKDNGDAILSDSKALQESKMHQKLELEKASYLLMTKLQKKLLSSRNHTIPTAELDDVEIKLKRLATKGVVNLFNAVKNYQRESKANLDTSYFDKDAFMQIQDPKKTKTKRQKVSSDVQPVQKKKQESEPPTWELLKNDFGSKLKNWDKNSDDE